MISCYNCKKDLATKMSWVDKIVEIIFTCLHSESERRIIPTGIADFLERDSFQQ